MTKASWASLHDRRTTITHGTGLDSNVARAIPYWDAKYFYTAHGTSRVSPRASPRTPRFLGGQPPSRFHSTHTQKSHNRSGRRHFRCPQHKNSRTELPHHERTRPNDCQQANRAAVVQDGMRLLCKYEERSCSCALSSSVALGDTPRCLVERALRQPRDDANRHVDPHLRSPRSPVSRIDWRSCF